jgi:biotin carboxyl carrier protein
MEKDIEQIIEEPKEEKQEYHKFDIDGVVYKTTLTKKFQQRKKYTIYNPGNVTAFIPGTIVKIFVKNGQKVKAGEKLLMLEAMKMQNLLLSPFKGVVKKIHTAPGDKVANKQLLVEVKKG